MARIANAETREYRSSLRVEQADETRRRILDATLRVIAGGIASVSMPAVAHEAGVSVPTVYRHFGSKSELLAAVYPHAVQRAGLADLSLPRTLDELPEALRDAFSQLDALDDLTRAAMASPASREIRALSMPRRIAMARDLAASVQPPLEKADQERVARVLTVLINSGSLRVWRDYLDASVDNAADDIEWVIEAMVSASRRPGR